MEKVHIMRSKVKDTTNSTTMESPSPIAEARQTPSAGTTNQSTKTTTKSTSSQQTKKRKRIPPEEQLAAEKQDRYDKLMYACNKAFHKEAKIVKAFECQKIVRKLKESEDKEALERKLVRAKDCCLDQVVKLAQQRLGLFNMNPKVDEPLNPPVEIAAPDTELVERMLQHKRLSAAMDHWNEKVTEYRRWCLRRQEHVHGEPDFGYEVKAASRLGTKKYENKKKQPKSAESSGLFVTLGGAAEEEEEEDENDQNDKNWYGPGGSDDLVVVKQNRMGQRARRAKALAKQAKKEGRTWDKSINWRPKKEQVDESEQGALHVPPATTTTKPSITSAPRIAEMGKVWKEEGQAHPSWAARASEKTGIVAFAGTKITFD
jgi:hypothetical protein